MSCKYEYLLSCIINNISSSTELKSNIKGNQSPISLYPNPTIDNLFIKSSVDIYSIRLIDINGRMIKGVTNPIAEGIDISDFPSGVYVISIVDRNKEVHLKKFIKL